MEIIKLLVSGVLAGLAASIVTAVVSKRNNDRNLRLKYITEERGKWRENVKENVVSIYSGELNGEASRCELVKRVAKLQLSLNPNDVEDQKIVECLRRLTVDPTDPYARKTLVSLTEQLLKHDWERAKCEAGTHLFRRRLRYKRQQVPLD